MSTYVNVNDIRLSINSAVLYAIKIFKYRVPFPANSWPPEEMIEIELNILDFGTNFGINNINVLNTESKSFLQREFNDMLRNKRLNFDTLDEALQYMVDMIENKLKELSVAALKKEEE